MKFDTTIAKNGIMHYFKVDVHGKKSPISDIAYYSNQENVNIFQDQIAPTYAKPDKSGKINHYLRTTKGTTRKSVKVSKEFHLRQRSRANIINNVSHIFQKRDKVETDFVSGKIFGEQLATLKQENKRSKKTSFKSLLSDIYTKKKPIKDLENKSFLLDKNSGNVVWIKDKSFVATGNIKYLWDKQKKYDELSKKGKSKSTRFKNAKKRHFTAELRYLVYRQYYGEIKESDIDFNSIQFV